MKFNLGGIKMNTPQQKAWETRKQLDEDNLCIICRTSRKRKKAKTCDQHCAGKLAWQTRLSK